VCCRRCGADDGAAVVRSDDRLLELPGEFQVVRCRRCGFLYTNPQPRDAVLARHYPSHYPPFEAVRETRLGRRGALRARLRSGVLAARGYPVPGPRWHVAGRLASRLLTQRFLWLPPFVPGGTLVDVGCATGAYLAEMRDLGWKVIGVEPDGRAATAARDRLDLRVRTGTLEEANLADACVDVVVMRMVLEHVRDPRRTLEEARRILKPGGRLLLSVPNADSLEARIFDRHWFAWDLPRHLSHFSPESLSGLLDETGLGAPRIRYLVNANNIAASIRYLAGRTGAGAPWHSRPLLPLAVVASLLRQSGRIAAEARAPASDQVRARSRWSAR
jgi:SAM-dependent methyltransferase